MSDIPKRLCKSCEREIPTLRECYAVLPPLGDGEWHLFYLCEDCWEEGAR